MSALKTGFGAALGALIGSVAGAWVGLELVPQRSQRDIRRSTRGPSGVTQKSHDYEIIGSVSGGVIGAALFGAIGAYSEEKKLNTGVSGAFVGFP